MDAPNVTCLLFGHDWRWREPIRVRLCRRCSRLDVMDPDQLSRRDARVGAIRPASGGSTDRSLPAAEAAAAGALPG